jgi:hypothetical protein
MGFRCRAVDRNKEIEAFVLYSVKGNIQVFQYLFTHKTLYKSIICIIDNDTYAHTDIPILTLINPSA